MSNCCAGYTQESIEITSSKGPIIRPLDNCGNKANFTDVGGEIYEFAMPIKFGSNPGEVVPALDGVDAIGLSLGSITATGGEPLLVQRTGHAYWSDVAEAIGGDSTSQAEWWAIHKELSKVNIYVEFK